MGAFLVNGMSFVYKEEHKEHSEGHIIIGGIVFNPWIFSLGNP
jgi:hypothetical protein